MNNQGKGIFRIGTSGIVVPGGKASFPEAFQLRSRLHYYSSLFNTLEVNSTFKKLPLAATLEKWALDVPEDFQFTIKLWRLVTHEKKLNLDLNNIDVFFKVANNIGRKKGCLLIQFPASITNGYIGEVEQILRRLQQLDRDNLWPKAIEFRSTTWYNKQTYKLLDKFGASMVLHDMPKSTTPVLNQAAPFVYCRYHGPTGDYRGDYSVEFLSAQSEMIRKMLKGGKNVYAYFNNTMGNAFENAMSLKAMVEK